MFNSPSFMDAVHFAIQVHGEQVRKGTEIPYVAHLLGVAGIVLEHGGGETEAIAALLHDAGEDGGGQQTIDQIRAEFGDNVAKIVLGCTDTLEDPKPEWRPRKEAYIKHVAQADRATCLVSAADKLHNARAIERDYLAIGDELWSRFKGGKSGTLWYYRELSEIFRSKDIGNLADELDEVVSRIVKLAATAGYPKPDRSDMIPNREKTIENDVLDIGWDEGTFGDGRPWRAEAWAQDQVTTVTFILPPRGLQHFDKVAFETLFAEEGLLTFPRIERFVYPVLGSDASGHLMWFVNAIIASDEDTYANDSLKLKPYPK